MKKSLFQILALSALVFGCAEKKQLTEMHDNTEQMNKTTGKMAETTDHMDKTTSKMSTVTEKMQATTEKVSAESGEMNGKMTQVVETAEKTVKLMGELYDASRQGAAVLIREKWFDRVTSDLAIDKKLVDAGEYFLAFEFAVWSGQGQDENQGRRDELAKDAVQEFLHFAGTVGHWDVEDVNPFAQPESPLKSGEYFSSVETLNQKASFNVLAAAMHKINRKQEFAAQENGLEVLNMFKLIETGLLAGAEIKAGNKQLSDFPPYVDEVLREEPTAIKLLQARYNMLGLILLGRMSKIQDSLMTGLGMKVLHKKWDFDLSSINSSQLEYFRLHLQHAMQTRQLLEKLNIKVLRDSDVQAIFSNLTLKASVAGQISPELDSERAKFGSLIKDYIQ